MQLTLYTCSECGETLQIDNVHYVAQELCPECAFWVYRITTNSPSMFQANGHAYVIGKDADYPKGFSGREWEIRFFDGRVWRTNSLWSNGPVPERFRDRQPDTAELIGLT